MHQLKYVVLNSQSLNSGHLSRVMECMCRVNMSKPHSRTETGTLTPSELLLALDCVSLSHVLLEECHIKQNWSDVLKSQLVLVKSLVSQVLQSVHTMALFKDTSYCKSLSVSEVQRITHYSYLLVHSSRFTITIIVTMLCK